MKMRPWRAELLKLEPRWALRRTGSVTDRAIFKATKNESGCYRPFQWRGTGKSGRLSESDLMARLAKEKRPGDKVPVTVLRGGKKVELTLPMQ